MATSVGFRVGHLIPWIPTVGLHPDEMRTGDPFPDGVEQRVYDVKVLLVFYPWSEVPSSPSVDDLQGSHAIRI